MRYARITPSRRSCRRSCTGLTAGRFLSCAFTQATYACSCCWKTGDGNKGQAAGYSGRYPALSEAALEIEEGGEESCSDVEHVLEISSVMLVSTAKLTSASCGKAHTGKQTSVSRTKTPTFLEFCSADQGRGLGPEPQPVLGGNHSQLWGASNSSRFSGTITPVL